VQALLNGLISGAAIALLATAFQVVYLPTRAFFIGLAGVYSAAPFLAYWTRSIGGGWVVALVAALVASVLLSVLCEWANHGPLSRRRASEGAHLVSSLGIYLVLVQLLAMAWGNEVLLLRSGLDPSWKIGGVVATRAQILTAAGALGLLVAFGVLLRGSALGLRLRALAGNPAQFGLLGYDVDRYRLLAFALSGLLAASAALVTAYDVGFDAHSGLHAFLLAVVAVILGGRGSFMGPILGALLLGMLRAQVVWLWSARWQEVVTFGLLAVALFLRPDGLIGREARLEASS